MKNEFIKHSFTIYLTQNFEGLWLAKLATTPESEELFGDVSVNAEQALVSLVRNGKEKGQELQKIGT